ncbi:concanavalin A-like lectin/glucanase superfamily protein [Motilibacter rhizosphaerae]|uniref:Concanavalin A-like lectin/glucanase superfamily protein n=1 Tax=Motilibacter rhizosphaerae TaxID=598652 RepID=A0A4Q7NG89_9ACTN|nr:LamG domain-containing protein [Motilibacter rhizosphaerae]RZS82758.1 concanavalin A-like lectin/glucanase superfamily protein [Motilibacter rhizosphaerae]
MADIRGVRGRSRRWLVPVVAVAVLLGAPAAALAAFTATGTSSSTLTAASHFNTYREAVAANSASSSYRLDESRSSSAQSAMTDSGTAAANGVVEPPTNGALGIWSFDSLNAGQSTASTAYDDSGAANSLVLGGGARIDSTGHAGSALATTADGAVTSSSVPFHTNASFTASTWVWLTDAESSWRTALAARGAAGSAFFLQYNSQVGKWSFVATRSDANAPVADSAIGTSTPQTRTWTLLTGVFDATAGTISLYVNGTLESTVAHTTTWDAQTAVYAGQNWYGSQAVDQWRGRIDDATVWQRALSGSEVSTLAGGGSVSSTGLALSWSMAEGTGTTTADGSGSGVTGTLTGGATWLSGRVGGTYAVAMGGGHADATRSDLDITKPFTVAAWVFLKGTSTHFQTAVSVPDGPAWDGAWLQADSSGKWRFAMSNLAAYNASGTSDNAISSASAATNTWVYLTGVYTGTQLLLYVNGTQDGSIAHTQTQASTGPLRLGQAISDASTSDQWTGSVDDVRVWQRAFTASDVTAVTTAVGQPPATEYPLDGGSGTTVADASAHGNLGTVTGAVTWSSGSATTSMGAHLEFPGSTSAYVSGAKQAVRTDQTFTVGAWVRPTATGAYRTAVAEYGSTAPAFNLQATSSGNWSFTMLSQDTAAPSAYASFGGAPVVGQWTYLTGVYDATAGTATLWINGVAQSPATVSARFNGANLRVGGSLYAGASVDGWSGGIDDVRLWQRALSSAEITALAEGRGQTMATEYRLDEGSGTALTDTSTAATSNAGTVTGSATWATGSATTPYGAHLEFSNDVTSYAGSASPGIDTSQSYTASAWVRLNAVDGTYRTAVSEVSTTVAAFFLQYDAVNGDWNFTVTGSNASSPARYMAHGGVPAAGVWTLLTGVFDSSAGTATLYVNGGQVSSVSGVSSWAAPSLRIGRARYGGAATDPWNGGVDDVRLWQQALSASQVSALAGVPRPDVRAVAGLPGALQGAQQGLQSTTALGFPGSGSTAHTAGAVTAPTTFSLDGWFRSTGTAGGTIVAFGSSPNGPATTTDRALYLTASGGVRFQASASSGVASTRTGLADGAWHHVLVSVSASAGTSLYVDGKLDGTDATVKPSTSYAGYWRLGSGNLAGLPSRPPSDGLTGTLDEIAVYPTALSAQDAALHYHSNH